MADQVVDTAQAKAAVESFVFVCQSRCMYCGRPTPHEACHLHAHNSMTRVAGDDSIIDLLWDKYAGYPPEVCIDVACPVWEEGEGESYLQRLVDWGWQQAKETIGRMSHEAWFAEKRAQGFADHPFKQSTNDPMENCVFVHEGTDGSLSSCDGMRSRHHPDMLPFEDLADNIKQYDYAVGEPVFKAGYRAALTALASQLRDVALTPMTEPQRILDLVHTQMVDADIRHGGPEHDIHHTQDVWIAMIDERLQDFMRVRGAGRGFKKTMLQVAQLAAAGLRAALRKEAAIKTAAAAPTIADHRYTPEPNSGRCVANNDESICTLGPERHPA